MGTPLSAKRAFGGGIELYNLQGPRAGDNRDVYKGGKGSDRGDTVDPII